MKKLHLITYSLLATSFIVLASLLFTSSTTIKQSNSEVIAELSIELIQMKEELKTLKINEGNTAISSDPFIGEVILFAGNFAPRGWAFCQGQLLAISQNTALFSILGTTYGGDGRTTFGLPDLRGRSAIGAGNGPGLSNIRLGQRSGAETHTLNIMEMPSHNHAQQKLPIYGMLSNSKAYIKGNKSLLSVGNKSNTVIEGMNDNNASNTGNNQSFQIRDPYLGINYIIALQGTFPSRN